MGGGYGGNPCRKMFLKKLVFRIWNKKLNFSAAACRFGLVQKDFLMSFGLFLCLKKMYTSHSCKMNDMSQFVKCVHEAQNKNSVLRSSSDFSPHFNGISFMCFLASVRPWLNYIHYSPIIVVIVYMLVPLLLVCVVCSSSYKSCETIPLSVYLSIYLYIKIYRVKPLITNTSKEFIKCRLDNFSMSFIPCYVNFSICENK